MRSYHIAQHAAGPVFFDRGVPDVLGYLRLSGVPAPGHMERAAAVFRYYRRVFITPPWQEIFQQDRERKQDLDETVRTYDVLVAAYTTYGYELVEIPRVSVEKRVRFVLQSLGLHKSTP
jgi:predicted ATPase